MDAGIVGTDQVDFVLHGAKLYPFGKPLHSYIYCDSRVIDLPADAEWKDDMHVTVDGKTMQLADAVGSFGMKTSDLDVERTPVLGYGSNMSPEVLTRKFGQFHDAIIPVMKVKMNDFDVVHSAHFYRGVVPATLQHSPGTAIEPYILYLTDAQLDRMHESESLGENYSFNKLGGVRVTTGAGTIVGTVYTYISMFGCLSLDTSAVAVEGIEAMSRTFPEMKQLEMQEYLWKKFGDESTVEDFIVKNATDEEKVQERAKLLQRDAKPLNWQDSERIL